jgi:hypothetical protein
MKTTHVCAIFVTALIVTSGCDSHKQVNQSMTRQEKAIDRPLDHVNEKVTLLNVDPHLGGEFYLETGTVISIPENAFVDLHGNVVTEPVKIELQEFHSASDILLSGITMHYEENGVNESFESGGMFNIEGSCNGKEVEVAKGKSLKLELASYTNEEDYDFFQLDTISATWVKIGRTTALENRSKMNLMDSIREVENVPSNNEIPGLMDAGATLLDIEVDYRKYPQLKDFYGLAWQVEASEKVSDISNTIWDHTTLLSSGSGLNDFKLKLRSKDQVKEIKVQPVISQQERERIEKRLVEARKAEAIANAEFLANANKRYESMANFQRNVSINGFGVYNCDRVIKYQEPVTLNPQFILDGKPLGQLPPYYLISNDNSAVSQYNNSFRIDLKRSNRLLFILGGGQMAFVTNKQLLDFVNPSKVSSDRQRIELQPVGFAVNTPEDLADLLKEI